MSEAIAHGISRYMLYSLRDRGVIEQLSRGVYRLVELPPIGNPDLVTVALRVPNAVICLISALAFHEMTTQNPHGVFVAIPIQSRRPDAEPSPAFRTPVFRCVVHGCVEEHGSTECRSTSTHLKKTIADCFKISKQDRHGRGAVALKLYKKPANPSNSGPARLCQICRVQNVMRPYLEATL